MDTTLDIANDSPRKTQRGARGPMGMQFTLEPAGASAQQALDRLQEFLKTHPVRKLRPGEKGAVAQLRESRDRR